MARIIELHCPNCNSTEPVPVAQDQYRCSYCGTVFVLDRERPRAPAPAPAPAAAAPPRPARRLPLVVAVAIAAVVVGGVALGALVAHHRATRMDARGARQTARLARTGGRTVEVPPVSRTQAEAPEPPRAELSEIAHAVLERGTAIWIATLNNAGKVALERPAVVVSLFDEAGQRVAEQRGWAPLELIAPGESSPVLVMLTNAPRFAKAEVKPTNLRPAGDSAPRLARLRVTEQTVRPYLTTHRKIIGTVRNEGRRTARFVKIVATGRDAAGKLVSFATGYATETTLAPGAESGFEVSSGTFDIREPARYEVFATGQE